MCVCVCVCVCASGLSGVQVLAWALPPSSLSRWQQPWLHVLGEAGKEDGEGEGGEWPGRVKVRRHTPSTSRSAYAGHSHRQKDAHALPCGQAIGREVRTLVVGVQDKLQAQLAEVESQVTTLSAGQSKAEAQATKVEAEVSSLKMEMEGVRSDMRELKDMLAKLLDHATVTASR